MNLANQITLSRIALAFVFLFFIFQPGWGSQVTALVIFIVAVLTDVWDGLVARKTGGLSDFGKLMDPIADKILVLSAFFAFLELGLILSWMVVLIVGRELVVTGLRLLAASKGVVLAADKGGKNKMISQAIAIIVILCILVLRSLDQHFTWAVSSQTHEVLDTIIYLVMCVTVTWTLISGTLYLKRNWERIARAANS